MDLKTQPFILYIKFLLQFVDKTFADITEWSNIVRKNSKTNAHFPSPLLLNCKISRFMNLLSMGQCDENFRTCLKLTFYVYMAIISSNNTSNNRQSKTCTILYKFFGL